MNSRNFDDFLDYEWAYDRLGVEETDDWAAITKAYRRMAQQAHPDRNDKNGGSPEEFIEISEAYNLLKEYWLKNQALPPFPAHRRPQPPPPAKEGSPATPRRRWRTLTWFVLALLPLIWILDDRPVEQPATETPVPVAQTVEEPERVDLLFKAMTIGELADVLGPPLETTANAWVYPDLLVFIRNGRVVDWDLRTVGRARSGTPSEWSSLSYGLTHSQVLELLGPPPEHTETTWAYGDSRVFFTDGKVTGWFNPPDKP